MGSALLRGWIAGGAASRFLVVEPAGAPPGFAAAAGVSWHRTPEELPDEPAPDAVVFAVKPQVIDAVLPGYRRWAGPHTLVRLDRGRQDDRRNDPPPRPCCARPDHAQYAGRDRARDHGRLRQCARDAGAAPALRRIARRRRRKRLGRGRGAARRGDRGFRQRSGLCLSVDRSAGRRPARRRDCRPISPCGSRAAPSPGPASSPACPTRARRNCART